jgi:hypothetical protein
MVSTALFGLLVCACSVCAEEKKGETKGKFKSYDADYMLLIITGEDGKDLNFIGPNKVIGANGKEIANYNRLKQGTPVIVTWERMDKPDTTYGPVADKRCTVLRIAPKENPGDKK